MTTPPPSAPAGWYPDPNGGPGQRYFDGLQWLDLLPPPAAAIQPFAPVQNSQYSEKSAMAAGLFQLFFGFFGIGRFYIGSTGIAFVQLVLGLLGLFGMVLFGLGLIILIPLGIWVVIDGLMMFAGAVKDSDGRKLR